MAALTEDTDVAVGDRFVVDGISYDAVSHKGILYGVISVDEGAFIYCNHLVDVYDIGPIDLIEGSEEYGSWHTTPRTYGIKSFMILRSSAKTSYPRNLTGRTMACPGLF